MQLSPTDKLRDFVLQFDQVKVFSLVTGITEEEISECLSRRGKTTLNVMRDERHPSVRFYIRSGRIKMYDFADARFRGDIFDIAGIPTGLNCNNPKEFVAICKWLINVASKNKIVKTEIKYKDTKYKPTEIDFNVRDFSYDIDASYWNKYGISASDLRREWVFPVYSASINKNDVYSYYNHNRYDRAYAIILYPLFYTKLYFIDRKKPSNLPRFITNFPYPIERPDLLKKANTLILIKSTKCRIVLNNILAMLSREVPDLHKTSIVTNSLSSESVHFNEHWVKLIDNYENHIIILDDDEIGVMNKDRLILEGFNAVTIDTGYKDLSDTYANNKQLAIDYIYDILWNLDIL